MSEGKEMLFGILGDSDEGFFLIFMKNIVNKYISNINFVFYVEK